LVPLICSSATSRLIFRCKPTCTHSKKEVLHSSFTLPSQLHNDKLCIFLHNDRGRGGGGVGGGAVTQQKRKRRPLLGFHLNSPRLCLFINHALSGFEPTPSHGFRAPLWVHRLGAYLQQFATDLFDSRSLILLFLSAAAPPRPKYTGVVQSSSPFCTCKRQHYRCS
jgi:hypothetical protein